MPQGLVSESPDQTLKHWGLGASQPWANAAAATAGRAEEGSERQGAYVHREFYWLQGVSREGSCNAANGMQHYVLSGGVAQQQTGCVEAERPMRAVLGLARSAGAAHAAEAQGLR